MSLTVEACGPLVLVEDLGRPGYANLGISESGAMDRAAHRLANRLVGNAESAATLEVLLGGLALRATQPTIVAVTGAPGPLAVDGDPRPLLAAFELRTGERLTLGAPAQGLRSYVAVRGGIDVAPVLGSRSTDATTGLGPAKVRPGDVVAVGDDVTAPVAWSDAAVAVHPRTDLTLRATWGPRDDWFTPAAREAFARAAWTVTAEGDRVGVRLAGEPLERAIDAELASEGLVRGAIQVPRSGLPLVFLADHPTTGGYPVIAVVRDDDVDQLAQARPGTPVRFRVERTPL